MLLRVIEPYWANREKLYKYSFLSYRVLLLLIIFCVKLIKEYHVMRAQLPRTQGFFPSRGRRSATSTHDASTVEAKCPCMGSMGPRCQLSKYLTFSFPIISATCKSPVALKFWSSVYFMLLYAHHIKYYTKVNWKNVRDDRQIVNHLLTFNCLHSIILSCS